MMDSNSLSRLLSAQPLAASQTIQLTQQPVEPPQTVAQATASDAERRQQEIAKREEERQRRAREKLASRQSQQAQPEPGAPQQAESDVSGADFTPMDGYFDSYGIEDLVSGARSRAEGRMGEMDRKPISEWSKGDWGKLLVDIGGGFAKAKDGQFSSGLSSASDAASGHLQRLDDRAEKWDDRQRSRMDALDDMMLEDAIRRRRILDDRGYDASVRAEDREYRSGERQQERMHERSLAGERRQQELADREDTRRYAGELRADERAYAERAAAAANNREDAKELRTAAAKNSRNYSEDYLKMATEVIKARAEGGQEPPTSEELDALIIPQLQKAYGISGTLGSTGSSLPANRTLSTGY